jgi:hypothetical protein
VTTTFETRALLLKVRVSVFTPEELVVVSTLESPVVTVVAVGAASEVGVTAAVVFALTVVVSVVVVTLALPLSLLAHPAPAIERVATARIAIVRFRTILLLHRTVYKDYSTERLQRMCRGNCL